MSRRNISKKRFPQPDPLYNSYLVSLLIARILKSGKKNLAKNIVYQAFEIIKKKTDQDPLAVFEKAIQNSSPLVEVKAVLVVQHIKFLLKLVDLEQLIYRYAGLFVIQINVLEDLWRLS